MKRELTPKDIGNITELEVISKLLLYGDVSIPYGNNSRYDCVLDYKGEFIKIQIKTAKEIGPFKFRVSFGNKTTKKGKSIRNTYSSNDVDYIATMFKGELYLLKTGNHINEMTISLKYPKNGIKSTVNLAENFLIDEVLKYK